MIAISLLIWQKPLQNLLAPPIGPLIYLHTATNNLALFQHYDPIFQKIWKKQTGQTVIITHSSGASGELTRAVISGKIHPDILLLSNPYEIETIVQSTGQVSPNWKNEFPYESSPFYSTVMFFVRPGNPKHIKDWSDLTRDNISLVFSNPTTCGGGRWAYTAALGYAKNTYKNDETNVTAYMNRLLQNTPILYQNQGESLKAFKAGRGDVLITYESSLLNDLKDIYRQSDAEIVVPSQTVEITMPVAVAITTTQTNHTTDVARAYLQHLYDPDAQLLISKFSYRPRVPDVAEQTASLFPKSELFHRKDVYMTPTDEQSNLGAAGVFDNLFKNSFAK